MPEIFRILGLRFYFDAREHEPMHVHVKSADGKAKFDILPDGIVLVYNIGMKTKDVKCAEMVLEENKELAISKWNEVIPLSLSLINLNIFLECSLLQLNVLSTNLTSATLLSRNTFKSVRTSSVFLNRRCLSTDERQ